MTEKYTGEGNPFFNKKHSPESIRKMSEYSKRQIPTWLGKSHTEEYKIDMSKNHSRSRKIICCQTEEIFHSIRECSRQMKLNPTSICKVLSGEYTHHHNYTFKYL